MLALLALGRWTESIFGSRPHPDSYYWPESPLKA